MGTNYYLHTKSPCETCGRHDDPLHIGKSSAGWCFSLHVMPEDGINDLADWVRLWSEPSARIINEYGDEVTAEEMMQTITDRFWQKNCTLPPLWYSQNDAEPGPNGLARHRLDHRHCIQHGAGTWDCIVGEFS